MNRSDMRRFFLFLLTAIAVAACGQNSGDVKNNRDLRNNDNRVYISYPGYSICVWAFDGASTEILGWGQYHKNYDPAAYVGIMKYCENYYIAPVIYDADLSAIVVRYEDAGRLVEWLAKASDRLDEIEEQMKDADVDKVFTEIEMPMDFKFYEVSLCGTPGWYDSPTVRISNVVARNVVNISPDAKKFIIEASYSFDKLSIWISDNDFEELYTILSQREYMKECLDEEIAKEQRRKEFEDSIK